jgi:MFS family permease
MSHHAISRHHPHIKYLNHKELDALYWSVFIKGIGDSLISVFTAVYLLSLGFTIRSVGVYYIIYFVISGLLLSRPSMWLGHVWGVKKTLALGIAFLIIYYALLGFVKSGLPYQITAVVYGIGASLYWSAFQLDLARAIRTRASGRALSSIQICSILASVVGPLVGAVFIVKLSFVFLFGIVIAILACSTLPLFKSGDYKIAERMPTFTRSLSAGTRRKGYMYFLYGITESAVDILWPVFLYMHYPHLLSIGGIISFTSLLMLFVIYTIGKLADRNTVQAYRTGVLTNAPTWILRMFWLTPGGLLVGNLLGSATSSLVAITVDQTMYRDAKDAETSTASLLFRSYAAGLGRILILVIAVLWDNSSAVFVIISLVTLLQVVTVPIRVKARETASAIS